MHEIIRGAVEVEREFICGALSCDLIGMNKDPEEHTNVMIATPGNDRSPGEGLCALNVGSNLSLRLFLLRSSPKQRGPDDSIH